MNIKNKKHILLIFSLLLTSVSSFAVGLTQLVSHTCQEVLTKPTAEEISEEIDEIWLRQDYRDDRYLELSEMIELYIGENNNQSQHLNELAKEQYKMHSGAVSMHRQGKRRLRESTVKHHERKASQIRNGVYVKYYNYKNNNQFRLTAIGNIFYQGKSPITCKYSHCEKLFVMDTKGRIYVGDEDRFVFHHSSFLSGQPVAAAGEMVFTNSGKIYSINNMSGHYAIGYPSIERTLEELKRSNYPVPSKHYVYATPK